MPNLTISEIVVIALVILIVFGPQRLPEMAHKAGELVRKGRTMVSDLRREFEGEFADVTEPLKEVRQEVMGMKSDLQASMTSLTDDVNKAKEELEAQLAETKKDVDEQVDGASKELQETLSDPKDETGEPGAAGTNPDPEEQS